MGGGGDDAELVGGVPGPPLVNGGPGGAGEQQDRVETLGEGVVDLAGEPLTLGEASCLVLRGEQPVAGGDELLGDLPVVLDLAGESQVGPVGQSGEEHADRRAEDAAHTTALPGDQRNTGGHHPASDDGQRPGDRPGERQDDEDEGEEQPHGVCRENDEHQPQTQHHREPGQGEPS